MTFISMVLEIMGISIKTMNALTISRLELNKIRVKLTAEKIPELFAALLSAKP